MTIAAQLQILLDKAAVSQNLHSHMINGSMRTFQNAILRNQEQHKYNEMKAIPSIRDRALWRSAILPLRRELRPKI